MLHATTNKMSPAPGAWEELMMASRAGDRRAYDRLLRDITPLLRAIAHRRIRDRADAEDAVQDTLLCIHQLRHTYDPARPIKPWIAAIAERRCIDRMRWLGRHAGAVHLEPALAEGLMDPTTAGEPERRVAGRELRDAVAALPRVQRTAITLTKIENLSLAEASVRSGISAGALKVATFRAVRAIRERLAIATPAAA